VPAPGGLDFSRYIEVFKSGSKVCLREKGQLGSEVEVIGITLMDAKLMYQVKSAPRFPTHAPVKQWVPADHVEPSAFSGEWEYGRWDTEAQEYVIDSETH
jgi:hypothetical protein